MKKYFFIAVMALSLTILQGCDEEKDVVLWEFTPADVMIHVVNANGENLLSPETPGCIVPEEVEAIYNGKVYESIDILLWWTASLFPISLLQLMILRIVRRRERYPPLGMDCTMDIPAMTWSRR